MANTYIVRFSSEPEAWSYAELVVRFRQFRVADYGVDANADSANPFFVTVQELQFPDLYTQEQLTRWKASGAA